MIYSTYSNIKPTNRYAAELLPKLKDSIEKRLNAKHTAYAHKNIDISQNAIARICFAAGLAQDSPRTPADLENVKTNEASGNFHETIFTRVNRVVLWSALLKLRYHSTGIDLSKDNFSLFRRAVSYEIELGADYLLKDNNLTRWLEDEHSGLGVSADEIPLLKLQIGKYEDDSDAYLDYNGADVPNAQTLIAGASGSGKSNLLAVLLHEIRTLSLETPFPVHFLLFDYKSEFSAPENAEWLNLLGVDKSAILTPSEAPLPVNPFEDLREANETERNLYSNELANALRAIDRVSISAIMGERLSEAILEAYRSNDWKPIAFDLILNHYKARLSGKEADSVTAILNQLEKSKLFSKDDQTNLVKESFIINMKNFPSDGPHAKAIVYFLVAKLNAIFKKLPAQRKSDERVELRHFTVIDEAQNMLDFKNAPLQKLIAEGRSKGLSIILATQNMASYKSEHFDFYANANYPLIMQQKTIDDKVLKDLFGVSGKEFNDVKTAVSSLQKGELIIKDNTVRDLGLVGKNYKKIKVRRLI